MNFRTLSGAAWFVVALWAFAAFSSDGPLPSHDTTIFPAIVAADCGQQPDWASRDAWYEYGDCSGDYGPIDEAE